MKTRVFKKTIDKVDYFNIYMGIINLLSSTRMSETELRILKELYSQGGILTKGVRKKIQESVGITDKNLNNFVAKMYKKGILEESYGEKMLQRNFVPPETEKEIGFGIILNIVDETRT